MRKFKNKQIPRGILIDRGYVAVRIFPKGKRRFEQIGVVTQPGIIGLAIDRLNEIRNEIRDGKQGRTPDAQEITLAQACDEYYTRHGAKKPSAYNYKLYTDRIKAKLGEMSFHEVTHHDVEDFKDWLEDVHKQSVGSVNKHMGLFVHLFNFLRKEVELEEMKPIRFPKQLNPAALVETDSEDGFIRTRVLSPVEFKKLLANATERVRQICKAAVFTLLRKKNLKRFNQVNQNKGTESLTGTQSKTGMPFALSTEGVEVDWLFKLDWTNFRREFDAAVKAAELTDFEFRDLRRTGATWLFRETNDLGLVQRRLGHASPVMTRRYLGIMGDDEKRASKILASMVA